MNQLFAGAAAITVAIFLLGIRRKPLAALMKRTSQKPINSSESLVSLSIRQDSNAIKNRNGKPSVSLRTISYQAPLTKLEQIQLQKEITTLISGSPSDRLKAIQISSQWGDKRILPVLKKGLKDSVSEIVIAAASGIAKFKSYSIVQNNQLSSRLKPPRNVSLMR